ncbi:MAG: carbohydrate ABC transporter permease [Clostridia bacterium]|nr:carbohydrate ABC transporter permease [Clostridia bacterium]
MSGQAKRRAREWGMGITALLLGGLVLFPVLYGALGAFKAPSEFITYPPTLLPRSFSYLKNFETVFTQAPMLRYFLNSFIVAVLGSVVRLTFAVLAAYAFVFFRFPGRKLLFFLLLGTMMLPADTLIITNYQTVSRLNLQDTYLGMCIVSFVGASQMFMLRQHFLSAPAPVREAAQIDGCGDLRFIVSILLPMSLPLLTTLFLQSFVALWNAYLWPLLVTNTNDMRTVQVGITMLTTIEGTNYETVLAGSAVALTPMVLLFLLLRRRITGAMSSGEALAG